MAAMNIHGEKDVLGLTLTYFTTKSNLVTYAFVWGSVKTMDFSETRVIYDKNFGRCSQLNVYMKLYGYQKSVLFRVNILKLNSRWF